ncbi:hypothetical protein LTR22_023288 [Elasticomyces elasticus]|nr:hypothetical protein LTR22_023288 [Elasticomyces elasticus]
MTAEHNAPPSPSGRYPFVCILLHTSQGLRSLSCSLVLAVTVQVSIEDEIMAGTGWDDENPTRIADIPGTGNFFEEMIYQLPPGVERVGFDSSDARFHALED